jgi:hypothetical protein
MTQSGGCLCGALRFEIAGEAKMSAMCLCLTCQKISGGAGNLFMGLLAEHFRYTLGVPARFSLDPEQAPTREFCGACGTHIAARSPKAPGGVVVKVGTLDDPSKYRGPQMVFWTEERQHFHTWPAAALAYERWPTARS